MRKNDSLPRDKDGTAVRTYSRRQGRVGFKIPSELTTRKGCVRSRIYISAGRILRQWHRFYRNPINSFCKARKKLAVKTKKKPSRQRRVRRLARSFARSLALASSCLLMSRTSASIDSPFHSRSSREIMILTYASCRVTVDLNGLNNAGDNRRQPFRQLLTH